MFTKSSRYTRTKIVETIAADGRKVNAVFLRRISLLQGDPVIMRGNDRLDIISSNRYKDPTRFWHIADANTELYAGDLVKKSQIARKVMVPE